MNNQQHFKLIDGTFTPSEASQVLCSLVKSKIDYHSLEKASNEERFGKDTSQSERRLIELKKLNDELKAFFKSAPDGTQTVKIDGWIEISFVEP